MKRKKLIKKIDLNNLFRWAFISIIIGFSTVFFITSDNNIGISNTMLERTVSSLPYIIFALQIILIIPIFEEFVFRYSIVLNKKYHLFYILFLLLLVLVISNSLIILFIALLAVIPVLIYYKKNQKKYITSLILFSSICFSLSHLQNISSTNLFALFFVILTLFGLGLLLMSIRIRFGILYSIIAHVLYNSIILFISYSSSPDAIKINKNEYLINIEKENIFEMSVGTNINFTNNTYNIKGASLSEILKSIAPDNMNKFYHFENNLVKYNGSVRIKNGNFFSLISELNLSIDSITSEKEGRHLTLDTNTSDLIKSNYILDESFECRTISTLNDIIKTLSNCSNIPINNEIDSIYLNKIFDLTYYSNFGLNENIQLLNSQNNLNIKCDTGYIHVTDYYIKFK